MIATCFAMMAVSGLQEPATFIDYRRMLEMDALKGQPRFYLGDEVVVFPHSAGAKYSAEVTVNGTSIKSIKLDPVQIPAFDKFWILRPVGDGAVELNQTGKYVYSIKTGDLVLKQIEFTLSETKSADPFKPAPKISIDGPWRSVGYFLNNPARSEDALTFECYSNLDESDSASPAQYSVTVLKGGTVVAQSRPYVISKHIWELQSVPLYKPDNKNYFRFADLTAMNSDFEVVVKHGSKRAKSFKGSTAGKAFKNLPEANNAFRPAASALLPKSITIPGGSVGKAYLVDVYWMRTN